MPGERQPHVGVEPQPDGVSRQAGRTGIPESMPLHGWTQIWFAPQVCVPHEKGCASAGMTSAGGASEGVTSDGASIGGPASAGASSVASVFNASAAQVMLSNVPAAQAAHPEVTTGPPHARTH